MKTNDSIPQSAPEGNPAKGDWWSTPHRPKPPLRANEQRAAAREAARDRAKCPRHHRDAANAAAAEVRAQLAPWATEHRVSTAWPNPRAEWGANFHAMCCIRRGGDPEVMVAEATAPTLAGALDLLTTALRVVLSKGSPIVNRWAAYEEHASRACPGMSEEEFARLYETITGQPWRGRPGASAPTAAAGDLAALGLRSMPTRDELRSAWHAAARRHHPDAGGRAEDFTKARAAYERLQKAVA